MKPGLKKLYVKVGFPLMIMSRTKKRQMTNNQNNLTKFWQELKRRKVVKVIIIYASTTFILLQLISILIEPLHLPQWVMTFFIVLLVVGFPIAVIFSWIFDVTPEGIKVTKAVKGKEDVTSPVSKTKTFITNGIIGALLIVVGILAWPKIFNSNSQSNINLELEKSIAVLPFKNDSNDSTNVYIINGMMESILNNLSKIKDLRVLSRTSVEKYRNNPKLISEMAKELGVSYIVEGSGQKIGDQILLTVQLIEAQNDKHLWSEQYQKEAKDIFNLQIEVSKTIADQIQVVITPEVEERIDKAPTKNLIAYNYYFKGMEIVNMRGSNLEEAIIYFNKAIELDNEFADAYARLALTYYYLDKKKVEKIYSTQINFNADKALAYDPQSDLGLIAKAVFYGHSEDWESGIFYVEKALEYNPNSYWALRSLAAVYLYSDLEKSLEYALKVITLDISLDDSITTSTDYYNIVRSFRFLGFFNEAKIYINKSLEFNPDNLSALYEKSQILQDENGDFQQSKQLLTELYAKDSTLLETIRYFGLACYLMRDYENTYRVFIKLIEFSESQNLIINPLYKARIGVMLSKMGKHEESQKMLSNILAKIEKNESSYSAFDLAVIYAFTGDTKKAMEEMREFSKRDNYFSWRITILKYDPVFDNIRELTEFKEILSEIESKFWANQKRIKASLEDKGLL
jgi:TolB-like protein/Tfp pilus assembly protein PilF